jgi:hypothetical protein
MQWSRGESVIRQCGQGLKDGGRYTCDCRYPELLPPSLLGRGRGRGEMPSDTAAGIRLPLPLWRGGRGCVINYETAFGGSQLRIMNYQLSTFNSPLSIVCAPLATEVVSAAIRSEIRDAGINHETASANSQLSA